MCVCVCVCVWHESISLQVESPSEQELKALKLSLADTQPVQAAVECCKTMDQVGVASDISFSPGIFPEVHSCKHVALALYHLLIVNTLCM